jgi:hypothetical protein
MSASARKAKKPAAQKAPKLPKIAKAGSPQERLLQKALFRRFAFDKRRYTPFTDEELNRIITICNSVVVRKKKQKLKYLEKSRTAIDGQIEALKASIK